MRLARIIGTVVLALFLGMSAHARGAPRSSAHLYVRGLKNVAEILHVVGRDLETRGRDRPPLLVVLVDPAPLTARAAGGMAPALANLAKRVPTGPRILVLPVDGDWPKLEDPPQDLEKACAALAAHPASGVRNLLGAVRRAAKRFRGWDGPKDLLLLATTGTSGEEETEETLVTLERHGFRFSVAAGESAFARPLTWAPPRPEGFILRLTGHPDMRRDTMYPACEGPFPDTPAAWDLSLAPSSLRLTPAHKYTTPFVLPSGFGYYHLARLTAATGGRYFLHSFSNAKSRLKLSYDYGLMRLFEPDLRSRAEILDDLPRHPLAAAIFKIWGRLAQPRTGVIRRHAPLGASGPEGRLRCEEESATSPNRILKLHFTGRGDTVWVVDTLRQRLVAAEAALAALEMARRAYGEETRGRVRTGDHRWVAQTDLLRLQLLRVRFHMGEILATLEDLKADDFHNESIVLRARTIFQGSVPVRSQPLPTEPRQLRFLHEVLGEIEQTEETYDGTPWGYMASLGELFTWVIATYEKGGSRPVVRARSGGKKDPTPKHKPKPPPPGSTGSGTATGGD